jgi:hypothetical protein
VGQQPGEPVGGGLVGPMVVVWGWWLTCSFSVSWCGEAFHGLGFRVLKFQLSLVLYLSQVCL